MPVSTSDGQYHDSEFDYWHSQLFGEPQEESKDKVEPATFLVRHGDTHMNDIDAVHGWVDAPLNDRGIEQAHKAAESLKDKDITHIVSSDLPRAKQTANIISKKLNVPVMFDPNLRTFDSGDLDGTDKHAELDKYSTQDQNTIPPGSSESFNQFKDRILSAMVGLQSTNQGRAAVVTHSKNIGVMNAWEHAGYPEDQGIHQPTYDDRDSIKPGGHEELEIPSHVIEGLFGIHNQDQSTNMEDVFTRGARQIAGGVIHGSRLHTEGREESPGLEGNPENLPQHEADTEISGPTKSYKIAEDPQRKLMGMVGPMRGEGGGTSSGKGEPHTSSGEPISVIKHPEMETSSQQQAGTNVNKYVHGYFQSGGEGHTIIRQMLKDGATQKEVAAELGITIPRVSQIIKNNNLNYSPDPNKKFPNRIVDTDKLKELFNKREESLKPPFTKKPTTWDDIGKELGVSGTGAYLQAQRLGLVKPANPKLKSGEPDWLVDELGLKK